MNNFKTILGIETSCDETAAAVLQKYGDQIKVLSSVISSSAELQAKFGGVIPEQAAREQLKAMIPVLKEALDQAFPHLSFEKQIEQIEAIAVTYGPGLIGSLLVGVETAKTLALTWNKPLLAINHLIGHYYANCISPEDSRQKTEDRLEIKQKTDKTESVFSHPSSAISSPSSVFRPPEFPCIGLLVSGGHTDLVLFKNHNDYEYLGGTRDDAAGECFDKCARLLGYPYPGGPKISQLAKNGDPKKYPLPLPMTSSHDYDFSFSGLKTAFLHLTQKLGIDPKQTNNQEIADLCASLESTIVKSLVKKTLQAVQEHNVQTLIVGGGVSANQKLRTELQAESIKLKDPLTIHLPELKYCGDNAAMIASAAFFAKPIADIIKLQANPNLGL